MSKHRDTGSMKLKFEGPYNDLLRELAKKTGKSPTSILKTLVREEASRCGLKEIVPL